ncbi:hypothetical protein ABFS82_08G134200 [Erythranthe guttata]|uniref:Uncharacterized protein n=1 Tax=Erythranthe guttata TaxID=4155 RepID=A0A022RS24_ERYGU|nr:PREDICTED: uncharacterized protein LOC105951409 [Erythranthe guttata]EYU43307.1 hypothetical protein MIMGU_mgv1a025736mg [Erythranthe guttata]|eukprot:XP_012830288.1 PREDICTED: uncharacterized protein LOC105951409 [Erythranthe guttata]
MESRISKTFQRFIHPTKKTSKNGGNLERESAADSANKNRAAMEAFVSKLFASISSLKAAYAALQTAQLPYNIDSINSADQEIVEELKSLSELKRKYSKKQVDSSSSSSSPPHVTLMLSEIQEQHSLMKTYEITMRKMQTELEIKESRILQLREKLKEIVEKNEKKMSKIGSFSVLDSVKFSEMNVNDFTVVLNYVLRSVRSFVKFLIREMECGDWDIEAAVSAIQPGIVFRNRDHRVFVLESFVCGEILSGFDKPNFCDGKFGHCLPGERNQRRNFFFEEFKKMGSVNGVRFLKRVRNSLFGEFLKLKYLNLVHPKMEVSFFGDLRYRKMVDSGEWPESEFFKMFAEMGRRVWVLHCLAFSFDREVGIFRVERDSRFSEVYMESVAEEEAAAAAAEDLRVAFTVVPGFKFSHTVVQSRVYLFPAKS